MTRRLWGDDFQLRDLLDAQPGGLELATRDFALLTVTAQLAADFPGQLVFKGGFILRHAFGGLRFSKDVDATRHGPAGHRLDAEEVAAAIRAAGIGDQIRFDPGRPATDSARSLDFDSVKVAGALVASSNIQIEVSYREAVVDEPLRRMIGAPFYEPFELLVMQPHEIAAEKLRTLAQRARPTDLADLAAVLALAEVHDADIARVAVEKFALVAKGRANRAERIESNLLAIRAGYDSAVPALFPGALPYVGALAAVWPRIRGLIPS